MSVTNTISKVTYSASGVVNYPITFYFQLSSHIKAYLDDTLLIQGTDFSVDGAGDPDGGNLSFLTGAPESGILTITREVPITQENKMEEGGDFSSKTIEAMYDKLTYIAQQLNEKIDRALRLPVHSNLSAQFTGNIVPHALLKMNADGTAFELGLSVDAYATQLQAFVDQANTILGQTDELKGEVTQLKADVVALLTEAQNAKDSAEQAAQNAVDSLTQVNEEISEIKTTLTNQFNLGDPAQDGSWRFSIGANNSLQTERKESGAWVIKQRIGGA